METNRNSVELWGTAAGEPVYSHENHDRRFYKFPLRVERLSGQADYPMIVVSEPMLSFPIEEGTPLCICGQLRSYNNRSGRGNRLILSTLAQTIREGSGLFFNRILLSGVLCKEPNLRSTPLGRSICDILLAVNRRYGRADYLPCIAWGQVAAHVSTLGVGDRLSLEGRVQSRTYTKLLENGSEERTAFEVSVMQLTNEEEEI